MVLQSAPRKIVLTGGPCAGKTTCLRRLVGLFPGQVAVVQEASSLLLQTGVPKPSHNPPGMPPGQWRRLFQSKLVHLQQQMEERVEELARESGIGLVICDRGVLDGAAYWPEGREDYLSSHGFTLEQAFGRYQAVICLESLAVRRPHLYGRPGDPTLLEDHTLALEVDRKVRDAWSGHPDFLQLESQKTVEGLLGQVGKVVEKLLFR